MKHGKKPVLFSYTFLLSWVEELTPKETEDSIMALSRAMLKSMGLTEEQVSAIVEANSESLEGLKAERDKYKADAEKLPEVQKELKEAQDAAKKSGDAAKIQKDFDDYKAEVQARETKSKKESALRKVAKDAGLTDAGIAKAVKYQDFTKIELDDNGEIKDAKDLMKSLKEEWPEHLIKDGAHGANTPTPPGGNGGGDSGNSRAAQLYKEHYATLYGQQNDTQKGDNNK